MGGFNGSQNYSVPQSKPGDLAKLYATSLPGSLGITSQQAGPTAATLANAAGGANPIYTASGQQQLENYAPGYAQAGNDLSQQQAWNQANLLANGGGATAMLGAGLNQLLNPVQAAANRQGTNLLNSYNLNGLSPGEYNATERSLNQSNAQNGNLGVSNGMNTISNAMNFGGAFNNKLTGLSNALSNTTGVSANQQTQVNPVGTALGAGNTSGNFGLTQFNPTQANSNLTLPYSFGSSLGNQIAGVAGASKSAGSSFGANSSCFLTTACCEFKGLPDNCDQLTTLRHFRDTYVPKELIAEYYRIAPKIVEAITNNTRKLEYVWNIVQDCVKLVKEGRKEEALISYKNMVNSLK